MTPREEIVQRLEAERYGPIVHDPLSIPHLPLVAYGLAEMLAEIDADVEIARTERLLTQSAREGRKRRARRTLTVLAEDEEASRAV